MCRSGCASSAASTIAKRGADPHRAHAGGTRRARSDRQAEWPRRLSLRAAQRAGRKRLALARLARALNREIDIEKRRDPAPLRRHAASRDTGRSRRQARKEERLMQAIDSEAGGPAPGGDVAAARAARQEPRRRPHRHAAPQRAGRARAGYAAVGADRRRAGGEAGDDRDRDHQRADEARHDGQDQSADRL